MNDPFREETARLRWSWDKHPREFLDNYLVSDVEDPRINAQSILTRALIADTLFPGEFDGLIDAEWRFAVCMTWLLRHLREGRDRWCMLDALGEGNASALPEFLVATYQSLQHADCPVPDYLTDALLQPAPDEEGPVSDAVLDTFSHIWRQTLEPLDAPPISIIEAACGSANDYRYIARCGLARFLDYTGFDISPKNIENARARFPDVNFFVGNVFQIPADDAAFDYFFVHDLFEHLSPQGLERAIPECLRVTRTQAWLSFFNLGAIPDHEFRAVDDYHWNTLSLERTVQSILRHAHNVEVIDIPELMRLKTGCPDYHNPRAKTLIVEM